MIALFFYSADCSYLQNGGSLGGGINGGNAGGDGINGGDPDVGGDDRQVQTPDPPTLVQERCIENESAQQASGITSDCSNTHFADVIDLKPT